MAVKKSELYSTLWKSCDKLRGGMDASQYKDYVLVLLFMKYVSDRAKGSRDSLLDIPEGGGFDALVALKGKAHIGDGINKVIGKLADANDLRGVIDVADFNDDSKLGKGKDMVDRLSDLVAIFENPALDFSGNQADGDDLLGDAYEYLMRNFATESGKSKGQFYTPAEVSRIMATVIGIDDAKSQKETMYDPTCGSGSLLLKAHDLAKSATGFDLAIYGQEMDNATAALARMNMWLHNAGTAEIKNNNTLSIPEFKDPKTGGLRTFDYVVANPPFSTKSWTTGVNTTADPYNRFTYGVPPEKNGDYAFLLHILASLKSTGKGAVILPHGVLFRGNAEATIRRNLVRQGFIKGIVGLPANLFYGTGIPACIILLDKEGAAGRDSIFMIDASKGFAKDGPKNRLRERDIHLITNTFISQVEIDGYSRLVPISEIAGSKNDYNLNLPRYIDSSDPVDIQDLDAHLNGGIPERDLDDLSEFWSVLPTLRTKLFRPVRPGYVELTVETNELALTVASHPEFVTLSEQARVHLAKWINAVRPQLLSIDANTKPKDLVAGLASSLLETFEGTPLVSAYALYQGLMEYWAESMQDDVYLVADVGWSDGAAMKALPAKKKGEKRTGRVDFTVNKVEYRSELVAPELVKHHFFADEARRVDEALAVAQAVVEELESNYAGEDMILSDCANDKGQFTKKAVVEALKVTAKADEEHAPLTEVLAALDAEAAAAKAAKDFEAKVYARYAKLTADEVVTLVVDDSWLETIRGLLEDALAGASMRLTERLTELDTRYQSTLGVLSARSGTLGGAVAAHLASMGLEV